MDIRSYKSGRKGLQVPLYAEAACREAFAGQPLIRDDSFALDARICQEDAYCHAATGSLRYLLLLSGVLPHPSMIDDPEALSAHLQSVTPETYPGSTGPIAILLIL